MNYNREQKRAMSRKGLDAPRAQESRRSAGTPTKQERTSPVKYLSEVRAELRKVDWPTRNEVVNSSIVVFVMVVFMALLIAGLDLGSQWIVNQLIR